MNTSESESSSPRPSVLQVEAGATPVRRLKAVWLLPLLMLSFIGTGMVVWLHSQQGGPTVTWSQASVLEFLVPHQTKTVVVTFRSDQDLRNVTVFVTPSLSSLLTTTPTTFSRIVANRSYQLSLRLQAGAQSEIKFDGTVQIKSAGPGPSSTYAQPLPVMLVAHSTPVPPDPGSANDQTIAGIDSDNDGVRDDVERYVILTYLSSQRKVAGGLQFAHAVQTFILNPTLDNNSADTAAINCLWGIDANAARNITSAIRSQQLNTAGRLRAWDAGNKILSGHVVTGGDLSNRLGQCTFDVTSLPN